MTTEKPKSKKGLSQNRRKSRELALKALYRNLLNEGSVRQLMQEMADDPDFNKADDTYTRGLVDGVTEKKHDIDQAISKHIDRPLAELSPVEYAILCISTYELVFDMSIPYRVAINEGVELAKRYGGIDGHKYVNGVLDKIASEARPREIKR